MENTQPIAKQFEVQAANVEELATFKEIKASIDALQELFEKVFCVEKLPSFEEVKATILAERKKRKAYEEERKEFTKQLDAVWSAFMAPEKKHYQLEHTISTLCEEEIQRFIDEKMDGVANPTNRELKALFDGHKFVSTEPTYTLEDASDVPVSLLTLNQKELIKYLKEGNSLPKGIKVQIIPTPKF